MARSRTKGTKDGLQDRLHQLSQGYDFGALLNIPSAKPQPEIRPELRAQENESVTTEIPVLLEDRVRRLAGRYDFGVLMKGVSRGTPFPYEVPAHAKVDEVIPSFLPKPDSIADRYA